MKLKLSNLGRTFFFLGLMLTAVTGYTQDPGKKIVGGEDVDIIEHPHQVRLSMGCGGSILSPTWILTAYHCTEGINDAGSISVRAGITRLSETGGQTARVKRVVDLSGFEDGDMALVELASPLDLTDPKVKAIPYISQELFNQVMALNTITVGTGWGATKGGNDNNHLQTVNMTFTGYETSAEYFLQLGGETIESACFGDSGGPLVLRNSGPQDQILIGVVSHGDNCNPPSYYGNIAKFATRIEEITGISPATIITSPNPNPEPNPNPNPNPSEEKEYVIRARGRSGAEQIRLKIADNIVETFTLTTSWANYTATSNATGITQIEFFNDDFRLDVIVDYLRVEADVFQSEDQLINTSFWANGRCGGGSNSQIMHCNGYIQFDLDSQFSADNRYQFGDANSELVVYPNPAVDVVTVGGNETPKLLEVYNLSGQLIARVTNSKNIDVSALKEGAYVLIRNGVDTKVIVKK